MCVCIISQSTWAQLLTGVYLKQVYTISNNPSQCVLHRALHTGVVQLNTWSRCEYNILQLLDNVSFMQMNITLMNLNFIFSSIKFEMTGFHCVYHNVISLILTQCFIWHKNYNSIFIVMSLQKHIYHNVIEAQFGNTHLLNNVKNFRIRKPFFIVFYILISKYWKIP